MPGINHVQIDANAAQHGEGGERVGLPAEIREFEAAIQESKHESEHGPHGGEPPAGCFVPRKEGEQGSRGKGVQVGNRAPGLGVRCSRSPREEVEACGYQ